MGKDVKSSLGGAASGAAAGATIGSVVPGIGTAIGGIAGGVIGLGASLFGGSKAANERRKMERYLRQQESENQSWYDANALSDYTQRADTQNLMKQLRDNLSRQNKAASNTAVVTGATPEQQAIQKEQSNKVISDTFSNIGAMGQQWKDRITDRYLDRKNALSGQKMGMMEGNATSYENLMNNGLNMTAGSLGNIISGLGSLSGKARPSALPISTIQPSSKPTIAVPTYNPTMPYIQKIP